jgi:hypothetical protein
MRVDVSQFAHDNGDIRLNALERALSDCVDRGDSLHDSRDWPSPAIQFDSWLNRRLAVAIRGWGNLVKRRGADPRAFRTLTELEELADFINKTLRARSQVLAKEMKLRWRRAVDQTALRHRNLITMSAWDVFPQDQPADSRYVDLLPLLRCANCLSFQRDVDISHWSINEFRRFYERVSAILRCSRDAGQIAKQV